MNERYTVGKQIRKFLNELFGSRLVEHLQAELYRQQAGYEQRLQERDQIIAELRQEALRLAAKFSEYELDPSYFWWLAQRGRTLTPQPDSHSSSEPTPLTWAQIQAEHYRQQEEAPKETSNGVSDSGRSEELRQ